MHLHTLSAHVGCVSLCLRQQLGCAEALSVIMPWAALSYQKVTPLSPTPSISTSNGTYLPSRRRIRLAGPPLCLLMRLR